MEITYHCDTYECAETLKLILPEDEQDCFYLAEAAGWTADGAGQIYCPIHHPPDAPGENQGRRQTK